MEGTQIVTDALGRIQNTIRRVLNGLPEEHLYYRPTEDANPICWLIWHLTRVQDHHMSDLLGKEQLWTAEGWHAKFGLPADVTNTGTRHTKEDVETVRADAETLQGYYDAVYERSREVLGSLLPDDLDKEINEPQYTPLPTIGVRLASIISDNTQHAGQAMYVRGLIQGLGWSGGP